MCAGCIGVELIYWVTYEEVPVWSTCECVYYCANRLLLSDIAIEKALKVFSQPNMFAGKIRKHKHTFGIGRVNLLLFYRPAFSYAIRMHSFLPFLRLC